MRSPFIFLLMITPVMLFPQSDSIYVTVQNDTATIWHTNIMRNCASDYIMDVQIIDYNITVFEVDTASQLAYCDCLFNLSVTLDQLNPGQYDVDIYSTNVFFGDTLYWGSTTFTIEGDDQFDQPQISSEYQSPCGGSVSVNNDIVNPSEFTLSSVYPNPFNPITTIEFYNPTVGFIYLDVYDVSGRKVETLINGEIRAGLHTVTWNAASFPSGIYFVIVNIDDIRKTQKVLLLK